MQEELYEAMMSKLQASSSDITELRNMLMKYKKTGIEQADMLDCLSLVKDKLDDDKEDTILDLLDFVTGFCNPALKIY